MPAYLVVGPEGRYLDGDGDTLRPATADADPLAAGLAALGEWRLAAAAG